LAGPPNTTVPTQKHHIFPQAGEFSAFFARVEINIHLYTVVTPRRIHLSDYHGGPGGGPWNHSWRTFMHANPNATRDQIFRHAQNMIIQFGVTSRLVPFKANSMQAR
jgi:uncharacterized lipoprotein (TIGR02269 family)